MTILTPHTRDAGADPALVRALKGALPTSVKSVVEDGVRGLTTATARWRPPPDFLVIGTKRGGTTTLWNSLAAHPQVQPMVPAAKHLKSPHYFYWHHHLGPEWYLGHFPTAASRRRHARHHGASVVGEASPMYLFDPRVPARVADLLPDVRIVVSLRDPVERAISHWKERVKEGTETLSFPDALEAEEGRLEGELERMQDDPTYYSRPYDWFSYRTRGQYAEQLERWFAHVDRSRVLVLRAEDLYSDQAATMARVHDFVGLDHHPVEGQWHNRTVSTEVPPPVLAGLREHFTPYNRQLADLLGTEPWWAPHPSHTWSPQ